MAALAGHCALTPGAAKENLQIQPGRYAVTVTYAVQEQRQNQSRHASRCIAYNDLGNPERIFSDNTSSTATPEETCAVTALSIGSGKVSYDANYSNRLVHVAGTAGGTQFSVVRSVRPKAGGDVFLTLTVRGTRIGDCSRELVVVKPSRQMNVTQPGVLR